MSSDGEVTELLLQWSKGNRALQEQLFSIIYGELHRLAAAYLAREASGFTLQASDVVQEAYLRLINQSRPAWENRSHFFAIAAQMMRRVLVDHHRRREARKRPHPSLRVALSGLQLGIDDRSIDLLALDEALDRLEAIDARQARIVEMRFIAGLTEDEIAYALGMSVRTVKRDWEVARAWLYGALFKEPHDSRAMGAS